MPTDDLFVRGNQSEAAVWILIAAVLAWYAWRQTGEARRIALWSALTFFVFSLSDLVEIHTGAWWRPWWLLMWKAACVVAMVGLLVWDMRRRRREDSQAKQQGTPPEE